jgi:hypothetical protein
VCPSTPLELGDCYNLCFGMTAQADAGDWGGAYADSHIFNPNPFTLLATPGTGVCYCQYNVVVGLGDDYCVGVSACTVNGSGLSRGQIQIVGVSCVPGSTSDFQIGGTCTWLDAQAPTF